MPPPSRSQPRRGGGKKRAPTGTPKQPAAAADDSNSDNEGDDASSPSTTTTTSTPLRSTHNQIERNYRNRVNAEFDSLRAVLPPTADDPLKERKLSKAEVLIQSRHYILSLEAEVRCSGAEKAALWDTWNRLYHTQYHQQPPPSPLGSSGGPGPGSGPGAPDRSGVLQR
ncbi:hypothetical protein B0H63DRAFT_445399 [Podospora didyma]|uniref:BHLH domain-containing protein n=1 Tax=Podospora didyma TaxID=330526 RepID=A0AAE0U3E6_9PEZI|nr:hypothetical protein B0H63DRAFT_445399 [Podospora didyma]